MQRSWSADRLVVVHHIDVIEIEILSESRFALRTTITFDRIDLHRAARILFVFVVAEAAICDLHHEVSHGPAIATSDYEFVLGIEHVRPFIDFLVGFIQILHFNGLLSDCSRLRLSAPILRLMLQSPHVLEFCDMRTAHSPFLAKRHSSFCPNVAQRIGQVHVTGSLDEVHCLLLRCHIANLFERCFGSAAFVAGCGDT